MGVRPVTAGQDSGVLSGTGMANRSTVPASVAEHVRRIRSLATGRESQPLAPPVQRGERGTTALEMAFVLPVLLLLTIGMVDAGRLLQAYVTVNHAAREAARFAVTGYERMLNERFGVVPSLDRANVPATPVPACRGQC